MKRTAAVLTEPGRFDIQEDEITCPDNGVVLRVAACGLCMSDIPAFRGETNRFFPLRLGHQGAGTVVETGRNVSRFKEGDRVTGIFGEAFSDHATALENNLVTVPENIALEYAPGDMLKSCISAARMATPLPGDTVMVSGCGAMGLTVLSALLCPSLTVIAVDKDENKLEKARKLGCENTFLRSERKLKDKVIALSRGRGVDVCIEVTGESRPFRFDTSTLVHGSGKLVLLCIKGMENRYDVGAMMNGTILYATHPDYFPGQIENLDKAMALLGKGIFPMQDIVTHRYGLTDIQQAFDDLINRPSGYIKGIVKI